MAYKSHGSLKLVNICIVISLNDTSLDPEFCGRRKLLVRSIWVKVPSFQVTSIKVNSLPLVISYNTYSKVASLFCPDTALTG